VTTEWVDLVLEAFSELERYVESTTPALVRSNFPRETVADMSRYRWCSQHDTRVRQFHGRHYFHRIERQDGRIEAPHDAIT